MTVARTSRIDLIQVGRAVASLMVVVYHATRIVAQPRFYNDDSYAQIFSNFNVGVDFFFVLSGFIITWVHWNDLGVPARLGGYTRKRFLRVFPPYWGVLFPLILLYQILPGAGVPSQSDRLNIALSIPLLPNPYQPVLGVAWTMTYEIFFYALFAFAITFGRRLLWLTIPWAIAIVLADGVTAFWPQFLFNPFNIDFVLGIWAGVLLRRWPRMLAPLWLLGLGLVGFVLPLFFLPHIQDDLLIGRLVFGIPAALLVLGAVEIERRHTVRVPSFLLLLGAASFAIYLVHPVALSIGAQLVRRAAGVHLPVGLVILVLFLFAAAAGITYHRLAEPRLIAIARNLIDRFGKRPTSHPLAD